MLPDRLTDATVSFSDTRVSVRSDGGGMAILHIVSDCTSMEMRFRGSVSLIQFFHAVRKLHRALFDSAE